MSSIKTFIAAFCTGAILLGILYILVPKGEIKKAVQYVFCLSFLCIILSVAVKLSGSEFPSFNATGQNFGNEKLSAALAKTVFAEALNENNIKYKKITVFTDKTDSDGINITKVYVYTAADYRDVKAVIGSSDYKLVVINE